MSETERDIGNDDATGNQTIRLAITAAELKDPPIQDDPPADPGNHPLICPPTD